LEDDLIAAIATATSKCNDRKKELDKELEAEIQRLNNAKIVEVTAIQNEIVKKNDEIGKIEKGDLSNNELEIQNKSVEKSKLEETLEVSASVFPLLSFYSTCPLTFLLLF
jgi:hypothetical protein